MNKIAKIMLGLLLSAVLVMTIIGCENESEKPTPTPATVPAELQGTWVKGSEASATTLTVGSNTIATKVSGQDVIIIVNAVVPVGLVYAINGTAEGEPVIFTATFAADKKTFTLAGSLVDGTYTKK